MTKKTEGGRKAKGVTSSRAAVGPEGWLNVIKEGGGTPSCHPFPSPARLHLFQIRKIYGERVSWRCKRESRTYLSTYLRKRDNGGSRAESREGAAKDFVVSRTFYSVSSGWRLLSVSQRTNSSSPSLHPLNPSPFPSLPLFSLTLFSTVLLPLSPLLISFSRALYSSLKALRNSQQPSP